MKRMRKRSKHDLSHYKLFTCNQAELVPIAVQEVLPGDTFQMSTSALVRVSPLIAPVMHPVHATIQHYFVPYRLIMDDWESFITGGETGADATTFPTITMTPTAGSLADYMGLPLGTSIAVNALPFRAYALIYNEFFRDQDLQTALTIDTTDGADTTTSVALKDVNWAKDRFTSSKDAAQKGSVVSLPLGTEAPIESKVSAGSAFTIVSDDGSTYTTVGANLGEAYPVATGSASSNSANDAIFTDLSAATSATITELREAFALQSFAEHRMMFGGRYSEYLKFLGIRYSDGRLDRPEYLGGGQQTIQFSEIIQTAPTTSGSTAGIGDLKGHGIGSMRSNRFTRFFEEHGLILSLMNVKPKPMYHQGVHKMWLKTTKEDFFQYELEGIGQEEILNKEVYVAHSTPNDTFGYQNRYDEYRFAVNSVAGDFRPGQNLDEYTLCRDFSSDPSLNSAFITCNPSNRIYASTTNDELYIMAFNKVKARRMMRKVGSPIGLIGA
jgi:hypothetical protein